MNTNKPAPSGCMVPMTALLGAGAAVWLLGLAIMVVGDAYAAPRMVIIFLATTSIAVPAVVVRNWAKGGGYGAESPAVSSSLTL